MNQSQRQHEPQVALRHGLTFRQAAITLVIVAVLGLLAGLIELYADWRTMRTDIVTQTHDTLSLVEGTAQEAAFQFNESLAEQLVSSLLATSHIRHVVLRDNFGAVFAEGQRDENQRGGPLVERLFGDLLEYRMPLYHRPVPGTEERIGSLEVRLSAGEIATGFISRGMVILILGIGTALLISALVVLIFYFMITRPLITLQNHITRIDPANPGNWPRPTLRGHDHDELGRIVSSLDQLMHTFQQVMEQRDHAHEENARLGAELEVSQRIQQILLPSQRELDLIESLEIATYMESADEVGGDYYDVLSHDQGVRIGIGDVTGHGLESGVVMLMAQSAVRTLLNTREQDIVRTMQVLNATIYGNVQRMGSGKNLSLALLDYQPVATPSGEGGLLPAPRGRLRTFGQHETIILVRQDGTLERHDTDELGFPIGLVDDVSSFINEAHLDLHSGDTVVLYTDGVTEAANESHQLYGEDRLAKLVRDHHTESAATIRDRIIADIKQHIGQQKMFDDITLLIFKQR